MWGGVSSGMQVSTSSSGDLAVQLSSALALGSSTYQAEQPQRGNPHGTAFSTAAAHPLRNGWTNEANLSQGNHRAVIGDTSAFNNPSEIQTLLKLLQARGRNSSATGLHQVQTHHAQQGQHPLQAQAQNQLQAAQLQHLYQQLQSQHQQAQHQQYHQPPPQQQQYNQQPQQQQPLWQAQPHPSPPFSRTVSPPVQLGTPDVYQQQPPVPRGQAPGVQHRFSMDAGPQHHAFQPHAALSQHMPGPPGGRVSFDSSLIGRPYSAPSAHFASSSLPASATSPAPDAGGSLWSTSSSPSKAGTSNPAAAALGSGLWGGGLWSGSSNSIWGPDATADKPSAAAGTAEPAPHNSFSQAGFAVQGQNGADSALHPAQQGHLPHCGSLDILAGQQPPPQQLQRQLPPAQHQPPQLHAGFASDHFARFQQQQQQQQPQQHAQQMLHQQQAMMHMLPGGPLAQQQQSQQPGPFPGIPGLTSRPQLQASPGPHQNDMRNAAMRLQPPPPPMRSPAPMPGPQPLKPAPPAHNNAVPRRSTPVRGASPRPATPRADMAALNRQLLELVDSLRPSPEELQRQQHTFQRVQEILLKRWPEGKVHVFGSTANQLSICNNNDIDVCFEMDIANDDQVAKGEVVEEMGKLLEEAGMKDVLPLPKARVPVVKFVNADTATKVDVTINNILAIVNTQLLATYSAIDPRLCQLAFVVKHWAKRRQVNDSYRGTLSSYCYVLMCIHHLQQRSPPLLPCLQTIQPFTHKRVVGTWTCDYNDEVDKLARFSTGNTETLAELAWSFFEYWAWRHDYNNSVISVRTAGFLSKAQKEWTRRIGNERHLICIEDPFELSHDLGRTVDRQTSGVLHKEFERAAAILRDLPDPLDKLFEPYRAGKAD